MDVATASTTASVKTPEKAENETPTRIQSVKPLSFTNGVLKRHQSLHHHHHHHHAPPVIVTYKECLKNHAAAMGGHAVDGCGEFMPSPASNPSDPSSLKCAACGCHRNFHRREPDDPPVAATQHVVEYQPHHRHHPPPPLPAPPRSPNSASPPPISSSYYPSAPHVLLALSSGGLSGQPLEGNAPAGVGGSGGNPNPSSRKRFRTKFSQSQKERMHEFAEKLTWKMQKRDDDVINRFCDEIGVERGVFKVWMHNNKNTLAKKDPVIPSHHHHHNNDGEISDRINLENSDDQLNLAPAAHYDHLPRHHNNSDEVSAHPVATNGSSSSS